MRQRTDQRDYINVTPNEATPTLAYMGKGFSALNEKPNAQTKAKRYVSDKSSTSNVNMFESSWDYTADQIRSEAAVKYLTDCAELHRTGSDAITQFYIVDSDRPAESGSTTKFHCRKFEVAIAPSQMGDDDNEMTAEGSILGRGDPEEGVFDLEKFSAGTYPYTAGWTEPAAPSLGTLTVTSAAGTLTGDTTITVAPTLTDGNKYKYQTAATVALPAYDADVSAMTDWNGTSDITATTGNQIMIVEATADNKARKGGTATVTAKA